MTTSTESSELDDRIVREVREHWDQHGIPILLSQLGNKHGGDIAAKARHEAGGLAAYLRSRLADRIQIVQHSSKPVIVGAIPAGVDQGTIGNFDSLLSRTQSPTLKAAPRYRPAFWAAFRKPLDETKRRYISIRAPLRFVDAAQEERPEGSIEIQREYIVGLEAEPTRVVQQAQAWLASNSDEVEPVQCLADEPSPAANLPAHDLLGRLLLSLDPEDLKRISMPLDIVSKLRRQSL